MKNWSGSAGICINEKNELLMVKDFSQMSGQFPQVVFKREKVQRNSVLEK
jgi:hypothetical protein